MSYRLRPCHLLVLALLAMSCLGAAEGSRPRAVHLAYAPGAISALNVPPATPAARVKIMTFIRGLLTIEQEQEENLRVIAEKYAGIDYDAVYALTDLTNTESIQGAKEKLSKYSGLVDELDAAGRQRWRKREQHVQSADLDEPLKSEITRAFAAAKPSIRESYDGWKDAGHANATAIAALLNFAERSRGQLRLEGGQLYFAKGQLEAEFKTLHKQAELAEQRVAQKGRAALATDDGMLPLLRAALGH